MKKIAKIKKLPQYIRQKFYDCTDIVQKKRRENYMESVKKGLINQDFSLIANNCNGGVVLHDLGLRFKSQFVNLSIDAADYIKYLEDFEKYNNMPLEFDDTAEENYPIGIIENIKIHFVHYKSKQEALEKWNTRKERIRKENIFFIFTEQGDCTYEHIKRFDNLDFPNKIVFTCKKYDDIKSAFYVKAFRNNKLGVYMFLEFKNHFSKYRKLDVFDWVSWFNGEKDIRKLDKQK